jgi:hypothetical protein
MRNVADAYLKMVSSNVVTTPTTTPTKNTITEVVSAITDADKRDLPVKVTNEQLQRDIVALRKYIDSKNTVAQVTAGSGEVRILRMDDINTSDIANNRTIIWDSIQKKFKFVDIPSLVIPTRATILVSTNYLATVDDYYIGVNSENSITITLPNAPVNGTEYIIKDESGHAQLTPIVILGNIDNDPGGVELRVNNGSVTVIYRNGWRII